jgi:hypothetical protein
MLYRDLSSADAQFLFFHNSSNPGNAAPYLFNAHGVIELAGGQLKAQFK